MMNKKDILMLCLFAFFLFFIILGGVGFVSADIDSSYDQVSDTIKDAQGKIDNIPKTPEEIRNRYLSQEWGKIISKNKYFGPIHNVLVANPFIFKLIFNEPYSISFTFIGVMFFWVLIFVITGNILKEIIKNSTAGYVMGACIAVILAQVSLIRLFVQQILYIIFSRETWWMRGIFWIGLILLVTFILLLDKKFAKVIKASREAREKEDLKQGVKEYRSFISGLKEMVSEIKKASK